MDNKVELSRENLKKMYDFMKWFQFVPTALFWAGAAYIYEQEGLPMPYTPVVLFLFGAAALWSAHFHVLPHIRKLLNGSH